MKRQSAREAWKLLILSLPKGIGAFVFTLIGLTVGVAASAVVIGLPLLAFVLIVCRRMLESEYGLTVAWMTGAKPADGQTPAPGGQAQERRGLKGLFAVLADGRSYRGAVYGLLQLPAGLVCFTLALAVPLAALTVMLAPAVWLFVEARFEYVLFADGWLFESMTRSFGFTPYEQSWIVGGFGLLLVLLVPAAVRMLGRFYAAWIGGIAGPEPEAAIAGVPAVPDRVEEIQVALTDGAAPDLSLPKLELERLDHRLAADSQGA